MPKKRETLLEDNDWSILRNPSPYRIGRAPGPIFNNDAQLELQYLIRKAEEIATFEEKARVVGQLEKLKPLLANLFRDITIIRGFIQEEKQEPMASEKNIAAMDKMIAIFDDMNDKLANEVFPLCDDLAVEERTMPENTL